MKQKVISAFINAHKKHSINEAYLNPTFAEDFQRSRGELVKILNQFKKKD
jgi:hypothetical protein